MISFTVYFAKPYISGKTDQMRESSWLDSAMKCSFMRGLVEKASKWIQPMLLWLNLSLSAHSRIY